MSRGKGKSKPIHRWEVRSFYQFRALERRRARFAEIIALHDGRR